MFTNEFEFNATVTTILDDSGEHEDFEVIIDDHGVFLRQWNETHDRYDLIFISHKMFGEFFIAMKKSEGAFKVSYG